MVKIHGTFNLSPKENLFYIARLRTFFYHAKIDYSFFKTNATIKRFSANFRHFDKL